MSATRASTALSSNPTKDPVATKEPAENVPPVRASVSVPASKSEPASPLEPPAQDPSSRRPSEKPASRKPSENPASRKPSSDEIPPEEPAPEDAPTPKGPERAPTIKPLERVETSPAGTLEKRPTEKSLGSRSKAPSALAPSRPPSESSSVSPSQHATDRPKPSTVTFDYDPAMMCPPKVTGKDLRDNGPKLRGKSCGDLFYRQYTLAVIMSILFPLPTLVWAAGCGPEIPIALLCFLLGGIPGFIYVTAVVIMKFEARRLKASTPDQQ